MCWRPAADNTIIGNRWTVGVNKEDSGQVQTTTKHCTLTAGECWPAERAVGDEKGKDNVNRRTCKEDKDDDNDKEEDCATATAAAVGVNKEGSGQAQTTTNHCT